MNKQEVVAVNLTNEAWKFLYVILSAVFCKDENSMQTLSDIFAAFEKVALDYDEQFAELNHETNILQQTYKTQINKGASKEQIAPVIDQMKDLEKKKEDLANTMVSIDIDRYLVATACDHVMHIFSINRLDEKNRAEGISGRHNVRLGAMILQSLRSSLLQ